MSAPGPWVIRLTRQAVGSYKSRQPAYVADEKKMRFGDWFDGLGSTTKVFRRRANAERWLRERPTVEGEIEQDSRAALRRREQ